MVTVAAQLVSVCVPVLLGPKWAFQGLEKIGRDAKRRLMIRNGRGAHVWELARDHHVRRVMDPREVPPYIALRDLSLSFRPFLSLLDRKSVV